MQICPCKSSSLRDLVSSLLALCTKRLKLYLNDTCTRVVGDVLQTGNRRCAKRCNPNRRRYVDILDTMDFQIKCA